MFSKNLPPFQPPRSDAEDREALTDSLKRIAEFAEKYQVKLYLEPLNRYENHMIHTVEQAASILQEVGSDQLQILGDFFHMNIEEADISNTIAVYSEQLGYYHLADSNRQLPGKGHTDFAPAFKQLQQLNYSGYLSLECRIQGDRLEELRNTVSFLRNQMA
ncbi:MAG: sugar phosphate isomerase/epimerase, partial [Paenibacillus sp.]|nr:sugar phosphate isomerase/epimerase [Paenibacillus sp.]